MRLRRRSAAGRERPPAAAEPTDARLDATAVSTDVGELLMPSGDQVMRRLMEQTGDWEIDEATLFRAHLRAGMVVFDIGAHVGYYTLLAARAVGPEGRVVAVEPDIDNVALLRANVERNGLDNVEVIHAAAWEVSGEIELVRNLVNTGDHRVAGTRVQGERVAVAAVSLDGVVDRIGRVDAVKFDTQAADRFAALGMERSLRRWHPVTFVEIWPEGLVERGEDPVAFVEHFLSLGYRITMPGVQVDFTAWSPRDFAQTAAQLPGGVGTLVLRPPRRAANVSGAPRS